ncbi:MAG: N-acetylmuramoyl-L-alanine amidase [Cyanobacteria bacterium P01_C01_bin.70]
MRVDRLIPTGLGVASALVFTLPAEAAQLRSWRFDARENQLVFVTDAAVQPRAQMIFNPTRIVIDLPGTTLGRTARRQAVGGAIQEVRSGQFNAQTARIVIELAPGYTLDPRAIEVQGRSGNQWIVQLPQAEQSGSTATNTGNTITGESTNNATTLLSAIVATPDGFFIRTSGQVPTIELQRTGEAGEERQLTIDLLNSSISPFLRAEALPQNRYSVSRWDVTQDPQQASTRVVMTLSPDSPDWEVTPTNIGNQTGIVLVPPSGVSISSIPDNPAQSSQAITVPPGAVPVTPQPSVPPQPTTPTFPPAARTGRVVVAIDPGHGGRDPGAVGIGGLQEKNVVFPVSMRVAQLLREAGVDVVMTRTSDLTLDLEPRVNIANRANATIFLSIHANAISLSRPDVNGVETYYASEAGRQLATIIHANVQPASGLGDRGVKEARFYVLRNTTMPAALLELGFVTGAQDVVQLRDPAWQERMAQAITRGILQYLEPYR